MPQPEPQRPEQPQRPDQPEPAQTPDQPYLPKWPRNPAVNPFEEEVRRAAFGPSAGEGLSSPRPPVAPAAAPSFEDPFDKLATRLFELGLYVRREVFVDGALCKIVAENQESPRVEVRVQLSDRFQSKMSGDVLLIGVREKALRSECESAAREAEIFLAMFGAR
jgi:hypothetical protein